jgi:hypothetical protein
MSLEPTIYVDFDDVLCDTATALTLLLQSLYGKVVDPETIADFDLGKSFDLNGEELIGFMEQAHTEEVLHSMRPNTGARDVLASWRSSGYRVWIVTGRPPEAEQASLEWLDQHHMPFDKLVFVDKYGRGKPGAAACGPRVLDPRELAQHDFRLAVDDAPRMLEFLAESTRASVVIFDRPWNSCVKERSLPRAARCRTWADIHTRFHTP